MKKSPYTMKIAMLSVHTCPLAVLGGKEAGGMNVYVRELGKELGRRGLEVDIFTRSQNPITTFTHNLAQNVRIIHLPAGPLKPYDKNLIFQHLPEFVDNIRRFQLQDAPNVPYDLIHGHYWLSGWAGLMLRKKWHVPVVQMFHTLAHLKNDIARSDNEREPSFRAEREAEIIQQVDRVIAATPVEKAQLTWRYGAEPDKVDTIPCGVDLKLFRPLNRAAAREEVNKLVPGLKARQIVLLVGRIEPIKGVDVLIEAVQQWRESRLQAGQPAGPDELQVMVVGGGTGMAGVTTRSGRSLALQTSRIPEENLEALRLKARVQELGLTGQILFVPSQAQSQMPLFYNAADIVAMPSRYESFGLAALEAQACGTPVVASRVGGLPFAVQDGYSGFLVEQGQPAELAGALTRLLENPLLRRKLGQQAAIRAEQFGWRAVADSVINSYQDLVVPATREKLAGGLV
ncbi:MAG: glycosyl transferase group 1 [Chloroflexi bacterium]|nr:glycosyl transferase group 1 [Chloroflexota bacterium]